MRLLHTKTLDLHEFFGSIPPYAILSHRWGAEEVTFDDIVKGHASSRGGYAKIQSFAGLAAEDGFTYCWVDTCCIDKSSSAELSESINSMFQWYRDADVCYAYLQDVRDISDPQAKIKPVPFEFSKSEWWQRGWTLQELIAPRILYFYDSSWRCIGSRNMLAAAVSEITSIDIEYFNNGILSRFSIAQKMSWASSRRTTRVEDAAYCMLGIFGINMPLLYGEGEGAFQRLQEEILRRSTDSSIFAWDKTQYVPQLLAPAPSYFRRYGLLSRVDERNFRGLYSKSTIVDRGASVTSKGVEITLPFVTRDAICSKPELARFRLLDKVAILNCGHGDKLAAVGFAHTAAGSIQRQLLGHTAVFMVPKNVVRDAILETVVLQKNPEASTSLWGVTVPTWHDPIEVNFPDLNSVGFSLKMISTKESKSQREWKIDKFPGGVRLNNYEPQNNSAPPTLIFSSGFWPESKADAPADGTRIEQRFSVSMKPTPSSLNMAIETDSGIVEGDSSGDWVSVVQSHRDDKIRLQAKTRRGPRYWIVTISIVSSKENSKRRQSASDSTRGSTRSSRK